MHPTTGLRRRPLVTIVGSFSDNRSELARHLMNGGTAVALCAGPPGCSLLRGETCALLETADATVVLATESRDPEVVMGLSLCAKNAPRCIVMEPSTIDPEGSAAHVRFSEIDRLAGFVRSVLHHPYRRGPAGSQASDLVLLDEGKRPEGV